MVYVFPGAIVHSPRSMANGGQNVELWFNSSGNSFSSPVRYEVLAFQGAGILRGAVVSTLEAATAALVGIADWAALRDLIVCSTGSYALQVRDRETGSLLFLNDPLGGAYIFEYEDAEAVIISSSLSTIKLLCSLSGRSLAREPFFELANFATGTAVYGANSPYKQVFSVRPGFGVEVGTEGKVSRLSYGVRELLNDLRNIDYHELIKAGTEVIRDNIDAALDSGAPLVSSDLSGGFDSRLVLAGVLATGRQDEVVFSSIRRSPEWDCVYNLAGEFQLNLTDVRFNGDEALSGASIYERAVSGSRSSGGFIDFGLDPGVMKTPIVSLQGGYGETFRTFSNFYYSNDGVFSASKLAEQLWAWKRIDRLSVDGRPLMTDMAKGRLLDSMSSIFDSVRNDGVAIDYITNATYLESRNRHWIGQKSFWWSMKMARLDPLYNLPLIAAAEQLDFWKRRANFVGLDAMRLLAPRLSELPFYNRGVVSDRYRDSRQLPEVGSFKRGNPRILASRDLRWQKSKFHRHDSAAGSKGTVSQYSNGSARRTLAEWSPHLLDAILDRPDLRPYFDETALRSLFARRGGGALETSAVEKLSGCLFRIGAVGPSDLPYSDQWMLS